MTIWKQYLIETLKPDHIDILMQITAPQNCLNFDHRRRL